MKPSRFTNLPAYPGAEPLIRVYQMPPGEIGYLTNLVEAYDGIGLVRTLDSSRGIIECWIMPDYEEVFECLLAGLLKEFPMQLLDQGFD